LRGPGLAKAARPFDEAQGRLGHPRETEMHRCFVASPSQSEGLPWMTKREVYWAGEDTCPYVALIGGRDARQTAGRMPALR